MAHLSDDGMRRLRDLIDLPDLTGTRYSVERRIGTGGMSSVFLVHDGELDRKVAMKVLTVPDERLAERMVAEAKTVAQLEHPNIVPIHDFGRLGDGRVFYTMKLVQGETLEASARGTHAALRTFQKVCDAVAFAHSRGIIHRDLKPSNVMVGEFGEVLVMDWGIAKRRDAPRGSSPQKDAAEGSPPPGGGAPAAAPSPHQTSEGTVVGTLGYMAPEQAAGQVGDVDARSDIYGLGAILYYLLTGRPPYAGDDFEDVRARILAGPPPPPRAIARGVPRRLEAICLKAMARNPRDRYQSAAVLGSDIARYLDDEPVTAYPESVFDRLMRWTGRNRFIVLIILAYVIARLLILFFLGT